MKPYQQETWFQLLVSAIGNYRTKGAVAMALGVSPAQLAQVLNASGKYGSGQASTANFASRVMHTFGRYECPHLTERHGERRVISAEQCKAFAHRPAPSGSPLDVQHWQACNACPHKAKTAPAEPAPVRPRKARAVPLVHQAKE